MNQISGKVVLEQSHVGIPNLLVVLYDVDPGTQPEESVAQPRSTSTLPLNALGDRLGSVLTDSDGSFSLTYEDAEFRIRNEGEKRPDVLLLVLAPETMGKTLRELLLFLSPEIRQNAGRPGKLLYRIDCRPADQRRSATTAAG